METTLSRLQEAVQNKSTFTLNDYLMIGSDFLTFVQETQPTRIVSPSRQNQHYIFYQYGQDHHYKITRPLNTQLFIESPLDFKEAFERLISFLADLKRYQEAAIERESDKLYIESKETNRVIYTMQQTIGCIDDSFDNANQARKRIGQLFETLIKLIIQEVGLVCEPRTVNIPIPGYPGYNMSYELDVVFSRNKAILSSETKFIHPSEIVGSVKTTSKDRIDKIFLDKYLLTKLLGRDIPVVAIFLHDVQRASIRDSNNSGNSMFGINSTFKTNHFLGYTVALNRLDGVYYVDPRPEMTINERLRQQIHDFQTFLVSDLWRLSR
jgi:hypothetical protein